VERYRTLLEINNAIISNLTEEALFRAICAAMRRIIPNDRSAIFLPDVHRDVLCLFAIDSSIESQRFLVGAAMDSKDSHAGWPFRHQRALLRRNLESEREFTSEDALFSEGFRSLVSVPLMVKGRSIGAYCISSREANRYSKADAEFLGQVAGLSEDQLAQHNNAASGRTERRVAGHQQRHHHPADPKRTVSYYLPGAAAHYALRSRRAHAL